METGLVAIRFHTCRATLTGCHYAGIDYEVPASFAQQVVERERCAEYVPGGGDAGVPSQSDQAKRRGRRG